MVPSVNVNTFSSTLTTSLVASRILSSLLRFAFLIEALMVMVSPVSGMVRKLQRSVVGKSHRSRKSPDPVPGVHDVLAINDRQGL